MELNCRFTVMSIALSALVLAGCGGGGSHSDLQDELEEIKRRPRGHVEPLPEFKPYNTFLYSAMTLRSPFDPPVTDQAQAVTGVSALKPDMNREKEFLEQFNLAQLRMVGTIKKGSQLWVLINDGEGGIHRVREGNYLGKNHGRIKSAGSAQIELIEIVPNGADGWVERPKLLQLVEKE